MKTSESIIKETLRDELQQLSKEELIEIVANLSTAFIVASAIRGANNISCLNNCIANLETQHVNTTFDLNANPFTDWSKSIFDANTQCCSIRKNLMSD